MKSLGFDVMLPPGCSHTTQNIVRFSGNLRGITIRKSFAPFFIVKSIVVGMTLVDPADIEEEEGRVVVADGYTVHAGQLVQVTFENIDMVCHRLIGQVLFEDGARAAAGSSALPHNAATRGSTDAGLVLPPIPAGGLPVFPSPSVAEDSGAPRCRCGELLAHEKHHWGPCPTPSPIRDSAAPPKTLGRPHHYSSGVSKTRMR